MTKNKIKAFLDEQYELFNNEALLDENSLDPIIVARQYKDEFIALVCALFAYGNVSQIVKFLRHLDLDPINQDDPKSTFGVNRGYRFQTKNDVVLFLQALSNLKNKTSLEAVFMQGYTKNNSVIDGIDAMQKAIREQLQKLGEITKGLEFLVFSSPRSVRKRWNMFLRWMVRSDNIDLGLWKNVHSYDLLIPLDTHTFAVSQKLGLLHRRTYDLKAVILITDVLREFDAKDPTKYDFAMYRIGQKKLL